MSKILNVILVFKDGYIIFIEKIKVEFLIIFYLVILILFFKFEIE